MFSSEPSAAAPAVLRTWEAVLSTLIGRDPMIFCSHWLALAHSLALMPLGFECFELVLHGIRVLAEQHYDQNPTNESKASLDLDQ